MKATLALNGLTARQLTLWEIYHIRRRDFKPKSN